MKKVQMLHNLNIGILLMDTVFVIAAITAIFVAIDLVSIICLIGMGTALIGLTVNHFYGKALREEKAESEPQLVARF